MQNAFTALSNGCGHSVQFTGDAISLLRLSSNVKIDEVYCVLKLLNISNHSAYQEAFVLHSFYLHTVCVTKITLTMYYFIFP